MLIEEEGKDEPEDEDIRDKSGTLEIPKTEASSPERTAKKESRVHPVEGYTDKENMWEKLWNLDRADPPPNKYPNNRSKYFLVVQDKSIKARRGGSSPSKKENSKGEKPPSPGEKVSEDEETSATTVMASSEQ